jgi:hypothetical protein
MESNITILQEGESIIKPDKPDKPENLDKPNINDLLESQTSFEE